MMTNRGFILEVGRHYKGYTGFWARFIPTELVCDAPECDKCGRTIISDQWNEAGHGATQRRAIIMAAKIALGREVMVPPQAAFEISNESREETTTTDPQ
jgi:hypothetical protein